MCYKTKNSRKNFLLFFAFLSVLITLPDSNSFPILPQCFAAGF